MWQGHQATIFNGVHVWSGDASKAAGAAVEGATKALQDHAAQLRGAIDWCRNASSNIVVAKDTISTNVTVAQQEIQSIEKTAAKENQNPDDAIQALVKREYGENIAVVNAFAMAFGAKPVRDLDRRRPARQAGTARPDAIADEGRGTAERRCDSLLCEARSQYSTCWVAGSKRPSSASIGPGTAGCRYEPRSNTEDFGSTSAPGN